MSDHFFNWSIERDRVRKFLKAKAGILHVIGTHGCHDSGFMQVVEGIVSSFDPPLVSCVLDSQNMATKTPLEALQSLLTSLHLDDEYRKKMGSLAAADHHVSHMLSNNRVRGDMSVEDVEITINSATRSENEEVLSIVTFLMTHVQRGRRFDNLLVIFTHCHLFEGMMRRKFWASVWEPALRHLGSNGARFIFHYQESALELEERSIPPRPTATIELPKRFDESVVRQIAEYAVSNKWQERGLQADVFAKTIYDVSPNAAALHTHIGTMKLQRSEV